MVDPAQSGLPAYDPAAPERLRRLGGQALLQELVDMFVRMTPERLAAARAGWTAGDLRAVGKPAHALKSSAGQLGACAMQALCERTEEHAEHGDLAAIGPLLEELDREFPRVREWLNGFLTVRDGV